MLQTGSYEIPKETRALIEADALNSQRWEGAVAEAAKGKTLFLDKVRESFTCGYCLDVRTLLWSL